MKTSFLVGSEKKVSWRYVRTHVDGALCPRIVRHDVVIFASVGDEDEDRFAEKSKMSVAYQVASERCQEHKAHSVESKGQPKGENCSRKFTNITAGH
jgi:hypothetical protein